VRTLKTLIITSLLIFVFSVWALADENGIKNADFLITIEISKRSLIVYKLNEDNKNEVGRYPVAVPKNDWLPLPLYGQVTRIELNPFWHPTEKTRIAYLKKKGVELPEIVRPNDARNAMGKAKILIKFKNFAIPIRIHGTNESESIGECVSRGCIRMHNEHILDLIRTVKNSKTMVLFRKEAD
jgi:lipoprotein-anchoring transpeptidase ErfK/SrfK